MADFYNFPDNENIRKSLYWMGDDYTSYILESFLAQFRTQDPKTEIIVIKCEAEPEFSYVVSSKDGKFHQVNVSFSLQFLVQDGTANHWRLKGKSNYSATGLHTDEPGISLDFELESSEKA